MLGWHTLRIDLGSSRHSLKINVRFFSLSLSLSPNFTASDRDLCCYSVSMETLLYSCMLFKISIPSKLLFKDPLIFFLLNQSRFFSLHYRDLLKNNFTAHLLNMKELFSINSAPIKMGNKKWRSIFNTGQFIAWHRMHFKGWLALKDKCLEITEKSIAYIQCFKGGEKIYQSEPRQILNYQRNAKQGLLFLFCFGQ